MKQLLQNLRTGETLIAEVPVPEVKPGFALINTAASLVSAGTERMLVEFAEKSLVNKARSRPDLVRQVVDKARREGLLTTLESAFHRLDQPIPLGYSSAGTVIALGEGVQGFQAGDRVACAGGNYAVHAEYALVPQNLLATLPDQVDFESAAFTTLGAIALHGFRLTEAQLGERVGVIGLGLLGLLAVGIARSAGCNVFGVDLDPQRVDLAKHMGADAVLRPHAEEAARAFSHDHGMDCVLICADTSSDDPVKLAGTIARDRGRIVAVGAVGLHIPRKLYYEKELSLINSRSYGPGRYDPNYEEGGQDYPPGYVRWTEGRNLQAFIDLLASSSLDVKPLITHRYPIEKAPAAYKLITGKTKEPFLGVLLTYANAQAYPTRVTQFRLPENARQKYVQQEGKAVHLGVYGAGNFATAVMLPALKKVDDVHLVGIAASTGLHSYHAAQKFGFDYVAEGGDQFLSDPRINTIAILTRHNLHAGLTIAGLQAGKHVFCEKPLAIRPVELESIFAALQEVNANPGGVGAPMLMVGFNRRFAPLAVKLHNFIKECREPLIAHYRVNAGYLPLSHWLHDPDLGGGRIIGEVCHFIDLLTFLVGSSPSAVTAHVLPDQGRYRQDNIILTFSFPDKSIGTLTYLANGDKAFPKERLEVFTSGRVAVLDDFRSLELVHNGHRHLIQSRLRQEKGHRQEWQAFAAAIREGGVPPIPYEQLFGVARSAFAAVQALREQKNIRIEP